MFYLDFLAVYFDEAETPLKRVYSEALQLGSRWLISGAQHEVGTNDFNHRATGLDIQRGVGAGAGCTPRVLCGM